jgi:hypothetical protein
MDFIPFHPHISGTAHPHEEPIPYAPPVHMPLPCTATYATHAVSTPQQVQADTDTEVTLVLSAVLLIAIMVTIACFNQETKR